ncbi:MAG: putative nucleic acid-binding protein [Ilumatobacter sp.]
MSAVGSCGTIFDTSAVIGLAERRSPELIAILKKLGGPITRSITVDGELRHGAAVADRPGQSERRRTMERYEQLSEWSDLEVSLHEVGRAYGDVSAVATEAGMSIGMNDRWIIAECVSQGARLVTADRRQAQLGELVADHSQLEFDAVFVG